MEAVLIGKALGHVGKIVEIIEQIQLTKQNKSEMNDLHFRISRFNLILESMSNKAFGSLTMDILRHVCMTLEELGHTLATIRDKKYILSFLQAKGIAEDLAKMDYRIDQFMSELTICIAIDIKSDTESSANRQSVFQEIKRHVNEEHEDLVDAIEGQGVKDTNDVKNMMNNMKNVKKITIKKLRKQEEALISQAEVINIDYIHDMHFLDIELGRGSFGIVELGEWQGIQVAIKKISGMHFVPPTDSRIKTDAGQWSKKIQKEVKAFEALQRCPYIVRFFGCVSVDQSLGLVTEFLENQSLQYWLYGADEPLDKSQNKRVTYQIACGLQFMHRNGVSHNDIKSGNIMFDNLMIPKIIDLGMSKIVSSSTTSGSGNQGLKGTDQWRAPEYWGCALEDMQNRTQFPYAGDVYSFAIIFCEIMYRQFPWLDYEHQAIKAAVVEQQLRPYQGIPPYIDKAWAHDPRVRCSMDELVIILKKDQTMGSSHYSKSGSETSGSPQMTGRLDQMPELPAHPVYQAPEEYVAYPPANSMNPYPPNVNSPPYPQAVMPMPQVYPPMDFHPYPIYQNPNPSHLSPPPQNIVPAVQPTHQPVIQSNPSSPNKANRPNPLRNFLTPFWIIFQSIMAAVNLISALLGVSFELNTAHLIIHLVYAGLHISFIFIRIKLVPHWSNTRAWASSSLLLGISMSIVATSFSMVTLRALGTYHLAAGFIMLIFAMFNRRVVHSDD